MLPGNDEFVRAEIVGADEQTDIAVLKVDTDKELPYVTLGDSDTLQSGELAVTIGNSMGNFDDSVTVGVISAPKRRSQGTVTLLMSSRLMPRSIPVTAADLSSIHSPKS